MAGKKGGEGRVKGREERSRQARVCPSELDPVLSSVRDMPSLKEILLACSFHRQVADPRLRVALLCLPWVDDPTLIALGRPLDVSQPLKPTDLALLHAALDEAMERIATSVPPAFRPSAKRYFTTLRERGLLLSPEEAQGAFAAVREVSDRAAAAGRAASPAGTEAEVRLSGAGGPEEGEQALRIRLFLTYATQFHANHTLWEEEVHGAKRLVASAYVVESFVRRVLGEPNLTPGEALRKVIGADQAPLNDLLDRDDLNFSKSGAYLKPSPVSRAAQLEVMARGLYRGGAGANLIDLVLGAGAPSLLKDAARTEEVTSVADVTSSFSVLAALVGGFEDPKAWLGLAEGQALLVFGAEDAFGLHKTTLAVTPTHVCGAYGYQRRAVRAVWRLWSELLRALHGLEVNLASATDPTLMERHRASLGYGVKVKVDGQDIVLPLPRGDFEWATKTEVVKEVKTWPEELKNLLGIPTDGLREDQLRALGTLWGKEAVVLYWEWVDAALTARTLRQRSFKVCFDNEKGVVSPETAEVWEARAEALLKQFEERRAKTDAGRSRGGKCQVTFADPLRGKAGRERGP